MKKSFVTLGLLIAVMPYAGFPEMWKTVFFSVSGLLIVLLVIVPRDRRMASPKQKKESSFAENAPDINKEKDVA